jgi:hypothetical protein
MKVGGKSGLRPSLLGSRDVGGERNEAKSGVAMRTDVTELVTDLAKQTGPAAGIPEYGSDQQLEERFDAREQDERDSGTANRYERRSTVAGGCWNPVRILLILNRSELWSCGVFVRKSFCCNCLRCALPPLQVDLESVG